MIAAGRKRKQSEDNEPLDDIDNTDVDDILFAGNQPRTPGRHLHMGCYSTAAFKMKHSAPQHITDESSIAV